MEYIHLRDTGASANNLNDVEVELEEVTTGDQLDPSILWVPVSV